MKLRADWGIPVRPCALASETSAGTELIPAVPAIGNEPPHIRRDQNLREEESHTRHLPRITFGLAFEFLLVSFSLRLQLGDVLFFRDTVADKRQQAGQEKQAVVNRPVWIRECCRRAILHTAAEISWSVSTALI